jgi:hypothetical protein
MVNLIRGRRLIAFAKMSRAFSRLLPAYSMRSMRVPVLRTLLDLVEVPIIRKQRVFGLFVGPIGH